LHDPADVERIARLLDDEGAGPPALGWNDSRSATNGPFVTSKLDLLRTWYARRVKSYARVALRLMVGRDFDARSFAAWWPSHRQGRQALWYWDERLHRELAEAMVNVQSIGALRTQEAAVLSRLRTEIHKEPPEVEAKVCLMANAPNDALLGPCDRLRLSHGRLLDLLDRRNLWAEVEWDAAHYNSLVVQVTRVADAFLGPSDVKRLQSVLARERAFLWSNGRGGLLVAISRLLPPATDDADLDRVDTREGLLRDVVRRDRDRLVRGQVVRELVRVGVARNWTFLEQQFFAESMVFNAPSDLRLDVLKELGTPPLTRDKRTALAAFLLDRRFGVLWTMPLERMGDDQYRQVAIQAVNAHAGREALSWRDNQALTDPASTAAALARVRTIVRNVLGVPAQ